MTVVKGFRTVAVIACVPLMQMKLPTIISGLVLIHAVAVAHINTTLLIAIIVVHQILRMKTIAMWGVTLMFDMNDILNFLSGAFLGSICYIILLGLLKHLDAKDVELENERLEGMSKALLCENDRLKKQNDKLLRFIRERMCHNG